MNERLARLFLSEEPNKTKRMKYLKGAAENCIPVGEQRQRLRGSRTVLTSTHLLVNWQRIVWVDEDDDDMDDLY